MQAKQKDKQTVGQLEKRLKAEQEARAAVEKQLSEEKKRKKLEEATAARAVALAAASRCVHIWLTSSVTCGLLWALRVIHHSLCFPLLSEGSAQTRCGGGSPN